MKKLFLLLGIIGSAVIATSCISRGNSQSVQEEEAAPPPGEDGTGDIIRWDVRTGSPWVYRNGNGETYLYIDLKSGASKETQKRMPLNISLVLDRSGSMSGDKIKYAKQAMKFVIQQLSSEDMVSIVNYDDRIEVTAPAQKVGNKEALIRAIDKIYDRGSTNLTGGMLEGYTQVIAAKREGYVNRVLLLTDGLANVGITNPDQIKKLVEKKYREQGVALSTFGLGADYNEVLLTQLAEVGHANYYFIDKADKIPGIFAGELKGLLNVVAQNATLTIDIPNGMVCEKAYGYPFELNNGKVVVRLNDVYANDEKAVLLKFRTTRPEVESFRFDCRLSYVNASDFETIKKSTAIKVNSTSDATLVERYKDSKVQEMIAMFESTERLDDIMADVDRGDYESARKKAQGAVTDLKSTQKTYKSDKLKAREMQIADYAVAIDSVRTMSTESRSMHQKSNRAMNYNATKMK